MSTLPRIIKGMSSRAYTGDGMTDEIHKRAIIGYLSGFYGLVVRQMAAQGSQFDQLVSDAVDGFDRICTAGVF